MFFHYATRKIGPTCKISIFFKDLSILNPRSHIKKARKEHFQSINLLDISDNKKLWKTVSPLPLLTTK